MPIVHIFRVNVVIFSTHNRPFSWEPYNNWDNFQILEISAASKSSWRRIQLPEGQEQKVSGLSHLRKYCFIQYIQDNNQ